MGKSLMVMSQRVVRLRVRKPRAKIERQNTNRESKHIEVVDGRGSLNNESKHKDGGIPLREQKEAQPPIQFSAWDGAAP